jgi:predicted nucleotidyltransferase
MSVLTYLEKTVEEIKIQDWEKTPIQTSITTLIAKMDSKLTNVDQRFVFGSFERNTILRRSKDENSDVDVMVVFKDGSSFKPQTLISRLKTFAENNYLKNEIYQDFPTIVLELSKIKFELVPAYLSWGTYYIPSKSNSIFSSSWISTNPTKLKNDLVSKHQTNKYKIRELILLVKYWNIKMGKIFSSYEIENYIISKSFFFCNNLKDYFYSTIESLPTYNLSQTEINKINKTKKHVKNAKEYESQGKLLLAEFEIISIF